MKSHIIEHDLIVERHPRRPRRRPSPRPPGRPQVQDDPESRAKQARAMYDAGQHTVQDIADTFDVSRPIIYRHLGDAGTPPRTKQSFPPVASWGASAAVSSGPARTAICLCSPSGGEQRTRIANALDAAPKGLRLFAGRRIRWRTWRTD